MKQPALYLTKASASAAIVRRKRLFSNGSYNESRVRRGRTYARLPHPAGLCGSCHVRHGGL